MNNYYQNDLDKLFNNFFNLDGNFNLEGNLVNSSPYKARKLDNGDNVIEINVAGIKSNDIEINVNDAELTIKSDVELSEGSMIKNVDLTFRLYDSLDGVKTSAKFENGILILTIPLKEERKSKKVKIEVK